MGGRNKHTTARGVVMRLFVSVLEPRELPASLTSLPILPDLSGEVLANVRAIALHGRAAGMNPTTFIKAGDSNTQLDRFFGPAGTIPSIVGLEPRDSATVARFATSFTRVSLAAGGGWNTYNVIAAIGAEIDAIRPAVALVTVGTNDWVYPSDQYMNALGGLIDTITSRGVIPLVTTLPVNNVDSGIHTALIHSYDEMIVAVAAAKRVPLLDLRQATSSLPFYGLDESGLHLNVSPNGGGTFTPFDRQFGQNQRGYFTIQSLTQLAAAAVDYDPTSGWVAPTHWTPFTPGQSVFAVGSDAGSSGEVVVYDTDTRAELGRVRPFERSFLGGVKVSTADVTGDGVTDLVTAAGYGGAPLVVAYDGRTGNEVRRFYAYEPSQRGGVNVAAGDTDGDGRAEIVVGAGEGGGPRVRVFRPDGTVSLDIFAFDPNLRTGVTVAAVGDGVAAGAGVGGGPVVAVFDGRSGSERGRFFAYAPDFRGGVNIAGGDLDGDGWPELVTAPGPGGGPHIRLFDPTTFADRGGFMAGDSADPRDGTRVAVTGRRVIAATGTNRALAVRQPDGTDAGMQGLPEQFPFAATFVG